MLCARSHVNVPLRPVRSGQRLPELTAAFDGPFISHGPISMNDILAIEIAGRAPVGGDDLDLIAHADWLIIRQREQR